MTYLSPGRAASREALALEPQRTACNQPDPIRIFVQNLCSPQIFMIFPALALAQSGLRANSVFLEYFCGCTTVHFDVFQLSMNFSSISCWKKTWIDSY